MRCTGRHLALAFLVLLAPAATADEMKAELKFDRNRPRALFSRFASYGYRPAESVFQEVEGYRFWLPAGVPGTAQTGVYSYFALAGDFEVSCAYELLNLQPPKTGYGSSIGLAVDIEGDGGWGEILRSVKVSDGHGYSFQSVLKGRKGEKQEKAGFVGTNAKGGRIGLRRVKQELIFLTADDPAGPLQEMERLPFTDKTIRAVRFFADPGGSATAIDGRVRDFKVQAEEITGGIPERDKGGSSWWWLWIVFPVCGLGIFWFWRSRRLV